MFGMKKATFYRHKKAGTLPRAIEAIAGATIRVDSIDPLISLPRMSLAKFGITAIRVMRGTDVIRGWDA
jgi:hypothetical protein